jgi:hypothetical protein
MRNSMDKLTLTRQFRIPDSIYIFFYLGDMGKSFKCNNINSERKKILY